MRKETISLSQAVCMMTMFALGSSIVIGGGTQAEQDTWISQLLATLMVIPLLLVYARIIRLFPEADLFDIFEILFGKIFGKIFIALIAWYALHLGALVIRNFAEFIKIVAMPETPELPLMVAMALVIAYMVKIGIEALGKWSVATLFFILLLVLLTTALTLSDMDYTNIMPVFEKSPQILLQSAFDTLTFPLAEIMLFLCFADAFKKQDSPYKFFFGSISLTSLIMLIVILRNIEVLGPSMVGASYFPSYTAARLAHVGDFLTRIEGTISVNFLLTGLTKASLCLLTAAKGTARLFKIQDHKRIVMPVSMLMLALCAIVNKSTMERFAFLKYYHYYTIPFQMLIPLAVWIVAEIRAKKRTAA